VNKVEPGLALTGGRHSVHDFVGVDEASGHRPRVQLVVFGDADQAMGYVRLTGELDETNTATVKGR